MPRPLIGITADLNETRYIAPTSCAAMVSEAGGAAVVLPCLSRCVEAYVQRCDGIILSGGDDPIMEHWGVPTHPKAHKVDPDRQAFELAVLEALEARRETPVLGICLGMQLMGLHRGGALDQYLPDSLPTAGQHWPKTTHSVTGELGEGQVHSHHRQALADAGSMRIVATAADGVIEAIRDDSRPFYLGVQWHPERTENDRLGRGLIRRLVESSSSPARTFAAAKPAR